MAKVVPKEGHRAPLFYSGFVILLATGVSFGQEVQQSDLERCASLATADSKLACFESLTKDDSEVIAPAAESIVPAQNRGATPATSVPAVEPASVSVAPAAASASVAAVPVSAAEGTASGDNSGSAQAEMPNEFGAEHLGSPGDDDGDIRSLNATVVEVEKDRHKILVFTFENGQVWRQIEGRRFSYPKKESFDVVINTGMMGDYRLRLAKGGPMTRIRRVK